METIDQNSMVHSMEEALVPPPALIDGRTEKDWLCFLTDFASLINFYDSNNMIRGNWTAFLAKDPVFLLAVISKTPFLKFHSDYANVCTCLEKLLYPADDNTEKKLTDPAEWTKELSQCFNQLFDQLTRIFMCLKRWIHYMRISVYEYPLKTYVIQQVKSVFSKYFWALLSLRQNLFLSGAISSIGPVDHSQLIFFEAYDEMIWKQNKDKSPYWDILDLENPSPGTDDPGFPLKREHKKNNIASPVFKAVTKVGNELFVFFNNVIVQAVAEFEILKTQKSKYPDTLLLRAFVNLLKVQQEQLNGITQKHLQFYYKDILKQQELPAVADQVIICAELAKKDAAFNLPSGTLLDAGQDSLNNPVLFTVPENVSLSPAQITGANTLAVETAIADRLQRVYLDQINNTGTLNKDENGNILAWETFGAAGSPGAVQVKPAIAFSSPLLLLREGDRYIKLTVELKSAVDLQLFQNAKYYLSTQNEWFEVTDFKAIRPPQLGLNLYLTEIIIRLKPAQPAIEAFLSIPVPKNPDGYITDWPVLKIEFDYVEDLASAPELTHLTIDVTVLGVKALQLYNDFGPLNTKAPYPLLGPSPLVNSNFIVGSNEIFSKPVYKMLMQMDWDPLPPDFSEYYDEYNFNLTGRYWSRKNMSITDRVISWVKTTAKKFWRWTTSLFKKNTAPVDDLPPFCNTSFTVKFENLVNKIWNTIQVQKAYPFKNRSGRLSWYPYTDGSNCAAKSKCRCKIEKRNDQLFSIRCDNCNTAPSSYFVYDSAGSFLPSDPAIQHIPLQFTGQNSSGFVKMTLTGPAHGFGSDIYTAVISKMAMYNAWLLRNSWDFGSEPAFKGQPKFPFVPKLTDFTVQYAASKRYSFGPANVNAYPLQCFLYTPFRNYKIYDSAVTGNADNYSIAPPVSKTPVTGLPFIPLYEPFFYKGYLFLGIENIIPSNELNFYFELARKYAVSASPGEADFYYLSVDGWKILPVLSEGTNSFRCSGIIRVNIPGDIAVEDLLGSAGKCWIAIAVKGDPSAYAQTVFLKTNGIPATRSSQSFFPAGTVPKIAAAAIKKFWKPIPQVSAIIQPFPSFGGKAPEQETQMNRRVANRVKTKDRVVAAEDYYRLIRQEYNDIYYSRVVFDMLAKITKIYVAGISGSSAEPNAFIPLVGECKIAKIQAFLDERASGFSNIQVSNFDLQYLRITAIVFVQAGFESHSVRELINKSLNIYLSPWISSTQSQVVIEQPVSAAQVAAFIKTIQGVSSVENVSLTTWVIEDQACKIIDGLSGQQAKKPRNGALFISYMDHDIRFNNAT